MLASILWLIKWQIGFLSCDNFNQWVMALWSEKLWEWVEFREWELQWISSACWGERLGTEQMMFLKLWVLEVPHRTQKKWMDNSVRTALFDPHKLSETCSRRISAKTQSFKITNVMGKKDWSFDSKFILNLVGRFESDILTYICHQMSHRTSEKCHSCTIIMITCFNMPSLAVAPQDVLWAVTYSL